MLQPILDLLFPPVCGLCDRESALKLCEKCLPNPFPGEQLLAQSFCNQCGEPGEKCIECKVFPLPEEVSIRSLWRYSERVEHLIKGFKYGGRYHLAGVLAGYLCSAIRNGAFPAERRYHWTSVATVPSTDLSIAERGYGHAWLIAREVAKKLKIRPDPFALSVRGDHPRQVSLKYEERLKHLHRKFVAKPHVGERVLLIDDVITSGASVLGASLALLRQGALFVDVITLARTEHFQSGRYELYKKSGVTERKASR
jgi:predicted amidophosphoribosyltransferase